MWQADQTIQQIINDNEYQQGASRGTVNAMAADTTQNWTLTFLNGDVSYARSALSQTICCRVVTSHKSVTSTTTCCSTVTSHKPLNFNKITDES